MRDRALEWMVGVGEQAARWSWGLVVAQRLWPGTWREREAVGNVDQEREVAVTAEVATRSPGAALGGSGSGPQDEP